MKFKIFLIILISSFSNISKSNSLFEYEDGGTIPSPLPFVISAHNINLDFDFIKAFPDSIQITFPDSSSTTVTMGEFSHRSGYLYDEDDDGPLGNPIYSVNPNASNDDFSFMWSGSNDEYDVVITSYKGLLSATISGAAGRFVIQKQGNSYRLVHVNLAGFPSYEGDTITSINPKSQNEQQESKVDNSYITNLKSFNFDNQNSSQNRGVNNPNVVDMLVIYNEAARIEAGGSSSDPNDTTDIEQKIIAEVDNLNVALSNSDSTTRATRFHVAKLNDFVHAANRQLALNNFRILNSVQNLRNQVGADVVSGIINTDFSTFFACGLAFGHTAVDSGTPWSIGAGFSEFAFNIITQSCLLFDFTFTHEFAHLLGSHHARDEADTPVASVVNNGFPYAFAWRDGNFKSVLSITQNTTERRLNFSNPNVFVDGMATGVLNFAHNQRVIDELTVFATNYRQRPDVIFINGFE